MEEGAERPTRASLYSVHGGSGNKTFECVNPLLKLKLAGGAASSSSGPSPLRSQGNVKEFLASISSFADFSDQQLLKLERNATVRSFPTGSVIFYQGDEGEEFFVLHQGSVSVYIQDDEEKLLDIRRSGVYGRVVNQLNEGSYFGERALMTSEPRAATVQAATDVVCYVFSRRIYNEIIEGVLTSSSQFIDLSKDHETRSLFKHLMQILDIRKNKEQRHPDLCQTFYDLTTAFTPELSADQIISRMVMMVREAVKSDRVGLFLLADDKRENNKKELVLKVSDASKGFRLPLQGLAGEVVKTNTVLNIQDAYTHALFDQTMDRHTNYRTRQVLGVPIRNPVTQEAVGTLQVNNRTDDDSEPFTPGQVSILELAAEQFSEMLQGRTDVFINSDWWEGKSVLHSSEIPAGRKFKIGLQTLSLGLEEQKLVAKEHISVIQVTMYLHLAVHEMCDPIRFTARAGSGGAGAGGTGALTVMRIDETDDFDIDVCDLPKSARIFFRVSGRKKAGSKPIPICWAAAAVFDFKACLNSQLDLCLFHGSSESFLTTSDSNVNDPHCSKMSVVQGPDLMVADKVTGEPRVRIVHEAPEREEPVKLPDVWSRVLSPEEEAKVDELRRLSFNPCGMKEIKESDRNFLWSVRLKIAHRPELLPCFVMCIRWQNSNQVRDLYDLLELWAKPNPHIALQLLDRKFMDPVIRAFAVNCLETLDDEELSLYMLQLCQQLKYEIYVDSALSRFLLRRALLNPRIIGHIFYWQLQSEVHNVDVKHRFERLLQLYIQNCGSNRTALGHQIFVMRKLEAIAHRVCLGDSRDERLKILREQLTAIQDSLPGEFHLPLNPEVSVCGLVVEKCRVMESKKKPLWLTFIDSAGAEFVVMLKVGDDLRQDALIMQLLRVMNDLWRKEHLEMKMNLYDCIATGDERGLLQVVLNSTTVGSILLRMTDEEISRRRGDGKAVKRGSWQRKIKSAMKALGDYDVIKAWMEELVEESAPEDATDEYFQLEMQT